jgi:uncharacterized membrane protein YphA (DoxX/SURF4 family)
MLLALLLFTFAKHSFADCLDLIPYYGLTIYFLIAGRNRISLDYVLGIDRCLATSLIPVANLAVNWGLGLGLMVLALDEKLLHPQLTLALLKHVPALNFMHSMGMSNDLFTLCAGLSELALGSILLVGAFPRFAVATLSLLFLATTAIFGWVEFFGHAPFYGMIIAILLHGKGRRVSAILFHQPFKQLESLVKLNSISIQLPSLP